MHSRRRVAGAKNVVRVGNAYQWSQIGSAASERKLRRQGRGGWVTRCGLGLLVELIDILAVRFGRHNPTHSSVWELIGSTLISPDDQHWSQKRLLDRPIQIGRFTTDSSLGSASPIRSGDETHGTKLLPICSSKSYLLNLRVRNPRCKTQIGSKKCRNMPTTRNGIPTYILICKIPPRLNRKLLNKVQ